MYDSSPTLLRTQVYDASNILLARIHPSSFRMPPRNTQEIVNKFSLEDAIHELKRSISNGRKGLKVLVERFYLGCFLMELCSAYPNRDVYFACCKKKFGFDEKHLSELYWYVVLLEKFPLFVLSDFNFHTLRANAESIYKWLNTEEARIRPANDTTSYSYWAGNPMTPDELVLTVKEF